MAARSPTIARRRPTKSTRRKTPPVSLTISRNGSSADVPFFSPDRCGIRSSETRYSRSAPWRGYTGCRMFSGQDALNCSVVVSPRCDPFRPGANPSFTYPYRRARCAAPPNRCFVQKLHYLAPRRRARSEPTRVRLRSRCSNEHSQESQPVRRASQL